MSKIDNLPLDQTEQQNYEKKILNEHFQGASSNLAGIFKSLEPLAVSSILFFILDLESVTNFIKDMSSNKYSGVTVTFIKTIVFAILSFLIIRYLNCA